MPPVIFQAAVLLSKIGFAVAGAVGATGLTAALGTYGGLVIGAAVVVGGALVAKKAMSLFEIDIPTVDTDTSRQRTVKSTTEPQKIIYGEALVSGPISFVGLAGTDNEDFYQAIVLAGHKLNNITDIHMDDLVIPNADINSGNAAGGQVGGSGPFGFKNSTAICTFNKHLGDASQTADSLLTPLPNYTTSHRGDGIAYLAMKWTLNEHSAKTWEKYSPQNVKALVQGKSIYDPRLDVTAGNDAGANPTNASYIAYSTNPALCLADYLMDATLGMGISAAKIDWEAIITAANGCDVSVSVPGGTEARFSCNGVIFATDKHQKNINKILSSMNGSLVYSNGKYILHAGIYEAETVQNPYESLNEDDLIGAISIKTSLERSDRFNTIKGLFVDPSQNHKSSEFPKVQLADAVTRDNGKVLEKEVQYPMTNSSYGAQRLSHKLIQLSDQQKIITFPANLSALRIAAGDRVKVTVEELSWTNKVFQCVDWTFSEQGGVNLTLREDSSTSYADPAISAYSTITATGSITDAFRGVPSPSGLSATAGLKNNELNWVNPPRPADYGTIYVYASPNGNFSSAVKIGETDGTQFIHDGSNSADSVEVDDLRYYWVRAVKNVGTDAASQSNLEPNDDPNTTVFETVGAVEWTDVANPTIGVDINSDTISINTQSATTTTGQAVATSGLEAGTTVTQGGLTMNQGGSIKGGQSAYNSGTGFFLGYDSGYKFSIGNSSTQALTFDGSNLSVTGNITATSGTFTGTVNASAGAFTGDVSTDSKFIAGSSNDIAVMDGGNALYRFYAGNSVPESAAFRVDKDGHIDAANIRVYDENGQVILDATGLHGVGLGNISANSGVGVSEVAGRLDNNADEITFTTGASSETYTFEPKVQIDINQTGESGENPNTSNLSFAAASESAVTTMIGQVKLIVEYFVKASGGSYSGTPTATEEFTFVSGTSATSSQFGVNVLTINSRGVGIIYADIGAAEAISDPSIAGARTFVRSSKNLTFSSAGTYNVKVNARIATLAGTTLTTSTTPALDSSLSGTGVILGTDETQSSLEDFRRLYAIKPASGNTRTIIASSTDDTFVSTSGSSLLNTGGTISGDLVITGDLTVQGTTTTINVADLTVADKDITLNYSTGDSSSTANNAGIIIQDAVNSTTDATLLWKTATDTFEFSHPIKAKSDLTLSSSGGDAGIYWKDSSASDATAWHLHADVTQATTNLLLNYAGGGTNFSFVNNGNFLAPGTIFADGAASNSLQWEAGYDYSQVGHLPLAGGNLTGNVRFGNTSVGTEDDNEYLMSTGGQLIIRANDSAADDSYTYLILDSGNASGAASAYAGVMTRTNGVERLRVGGDGTIKFFEDTGTTAKLVWNPTSESLTFGSNLAITSNEIDVSSGDLTLDVAGNIVLDADGGEVFFKDGGTSTGKIRMNDGDLQIRSLISDKDITLEGNDGGSIFEAMRLDMSNAGRAIFNAGASFSDHVYLADNARLTLGGGDDLQIYHTGSDSRILDNGTGNLRIMANNLRMQSALGEQYIVADDGGAVTLYYNNAAKLATSSSGIDVTGSVTADGLTVDASTTDMITLNHSTPSNLITMGQDSSGDFRIRSDSVNKLKLYANGDFELFEDTGTTAKLTWDASAESLNFADNSKALFGAGSDLQIYHDGSNSYIDETATGHLFIRSNGDGIYLRSSTNEEIAHFNVNGSVKAYYDNSLKLETTSTGIDVTGTATVDGLVVGGSATGTITLGEAGYNGTIQAPHSIALDAQGAGENVVIKTQSTERLKINADGSSVFSGAVTSTGLTVNNNTYAQLQLTGTNETWINFGDASDSDVGQIHYAHSTNKMNFKTNATSALTLDSSQNVNIPNGSLMVGATTAPLFDLHVSDTNANIGIESTTNNQNASLYFRAHTANQWETGVNITAGLDYEIYDRVNNSSRFVVSHSGNVNIPNGGLMVGSTAAPSALLQLEGSDGTPQLKFLRTGTNIGGIIRQTSNPYGLTYDAIDGNAGTPTHVFRTSVDGSSFTERMRIMQDGAVVINPLNGDGQIYFNATTGNLTMFLAKSGLETLLWNRANGAMRFGTNDTERLRIDSSGNIGFGVTPNANWSSSYRAIDAFGGATFQFEGGSTRQGQNFYGYPWKYKATRTASSIAHTAGGDISFQVAPSGTADSAITWSQAMLIKNGGNVGIGTNSPLSSLTVAGTAPAASSPATYSGTIQINETALSTLQEVGGLEFRGAVFGSGYGSKITSTDTGHLLFGRRSNSATWSESMRIDSSGNVMVGKTSLDFGATSGQEFRVDGRVFIGNSGAGHFVNRIGSDGAISGFRKDGTPVGSIGTEGGDLNIGNGDAGLQFINGTQSVRPFNVTTNARIDAQVDLGMASTRFKNLYLSGGVYANNASGAFLWNASNATIAFGTNNIERARITSDGKFGLGTASPSAKLDVQTGNAGSAIRLSATDGSSGASYKATTASGNFYAGIDTSSGGSFGAANSAVLWYDANQPMIFATNNSRKMTLAADGNVGIGVVPSASYYTSLEIGNSGSSITGRGAADTHFMSGLFWDAGSTYKYSVSSVAVGSYQITNGIHYWATAPAGTAGNAATPQTNMVLDASGNVGISVTPSAFVLPDGSSGALQLQSGGMVSAYAGVTHLSQNWYYNSGEKYIANGSASRLVMSGADYIWQSAGNNTSGAGAALTWSESMRLSGGTLLAGTTTVNGEGITLSGNNNYGYFSRSGDAALFVNRAGTDGDALGFRRGGAGVGSISVNGSGTFYNTSSDQRLKDKIVDAPSASDDIDAIRVRSFDWKADGQHQKYGMIAQELIEVAPEAVSAPEDPEEMMGVDYSKLVPMLIKEIQQLRKRVKHLEEE